MSEVGPQVLGDGDTGGGGPPAVGMLVAALLSRSGTPHRGEQSHTPLAGLDVVERCALINAIVEDLNRRGDLDDRPRELPVVRATYFEEGHRWAGWRSDMAPPVPSELAGRSGLVLRAMRRLPPAMRVVLVAHDVAGVPVEELHRVAAGTVDQQMVFLDAARRAYVAALVDEVGATP